MDSFCHQGRGGLAKQLSCCPQEWVGCFCSVEAVELPAKKQRPKRRHGGSWAFLLCFSFNLLWLHDDGPTPSYLMASAQALWWPQERTAGAAPLLDVHRELGPFCLKSYLVWSYRLNHTGNFNSAKDYIVDRFCFCLFRPKETENEGFI